MAKPLRFYVVTFAIAPGPGPAFNDAITDYFHAEDLSALLDAIEAEYEYIALRIDRIWKDESVEIIAE